MKLADRVRRTLRAARREWSRPARRAVTVQLVTSGGGGGSATRNDPPPRAAPDIQETS